MKKIFNKSIITLIICIISFGCLYLGLTSANTCTHPIIQESIVQVSQKQIRKVNTINESRKLAYAAVDKHIKSIAPKSKVTGKAIVEGCIKYNVDIRLVLAQAQQESHFGTTGVAKKTNSIFNVNAWDGRSAKDMNRKGHGYKHPDQSIPPFLKLLKKDYLTNGKTSKHLLRNFVNKNGKRYASSKLYEARVSNIYYKIPKDIVTKFNVYKQKVNNSQIY